MSDLSSIKNDIIAPALRAIDLCSSTSLSLVCGTGNKESGYRTRAQYNGGPARSWFQIEEPTYNDVWKRAVLTRPKLERQIRDFIYPFAPSFSLLSTNDGFAAIICRLKYFLIPEALPTSCTAENLALYWKKYYNTSLGKGVVNPATIALFREAINA